MKASPYDWTITPPGCQMSGSDMTPTQTQTQGREGDALLFRFSDSPLTRAGWLMEVHSDGVSLETAGLRTSHRFTWAEFTQALVQWSPENLPSQSDLKAPQDLPPVWDGVSYAPDDGEGARVPHSTAQDLMDSMTQRLKSDPGSRVDFPGDEGEEDVY